jgi:hypothetical protein
VQPGLPRTSPTALGLPRASPVLHVRMAALGSQDPHAVENLFQYRLSEELYAKAGVSSRYAQQLVTRPITMTCRALPLE